MDAGKKKPRRKRKEKDSIRYINPAYPDALKVSRMNLKALLSPFIRNLVK